MRRQSECQDAGGAARAAESGPLEPLHSISYTQAPVRFDNSTNVDSTPHVFFSLPHLLLFHPSRLVKNRARE
ncbi:hypothetical protein Y032_0061g3271 [Ancylostoma ceylanicum]|uniref:Uncharacterized protein n=1 Tax=Ancylostoma ceylanicum TaxID=53326 RepID=A0A016U3V9_9BILA|nr:hypothetical protein Y032_0061g3271 [Ancylostoma ceylanicum]